jgi:hypothetical protein
VNAIWRSLFVRVFIVGAVLFGLAWALAPLLAPSSAPSLCEALARRRIVYVRADGEATLRCEGVHVEASDKEVHAALAAPEPEPLLQILRARKASAVALVPGEKRAGVGGQLAALAHVSGLRAVALAPEVAVYAPVHEIGLSLAERDALAYVARALFRGAREPSVASFPADLRRVERVEVMVTLGRGGEPRLWRSARGTSIARALLTATRVARDRWREREQAMGGPLAERLLELDVEVALLSEDGALVGAQRGFVDRAITPLHGIGFDHRTAWHYVLPRDVAKRKGGFQALSIQLNEVGLSQSILAERDTRLYRFVVVPLGTSKAPLAPGAKAP